MVSCLKCVCSNVHIQVTGELNGFPDEERLCYVFLVKLKTYSSFIAIQGTV